MRGRRIAAVSTLGLFGSLLTIGLLTASTASAVPLHGQLRWTLLSTSSAPSPRKYVQMAYDAYTGKVVEYGGYNQNANPQFYYDTWTFARGSWSRVNTTTHPSAPSGLVLAYDPALHGVLAFGGEAPFSSAYYNDTWLFSGGNWTLLHPTVSPSPRSQYAMAWDAFDNEIVLFGGTGPVPTNSSNGTSTFVSSTLHDTWVFNGTTWMRVRSTLHPDGRSGARMVFDPSDNLTLLVGGYHASAWLNQTWAFQAGQWTLLPNTATPIHNLAYLANLPNGTPIMFGGEFPNKPMQKYNTSFEFLGGVWQRVGEKNAPPPLANGGLVYDAADGYDVLYGGGFSSLYCTGETWTLV